MLLLLALLVAGCSQVSGGGAGSGPPAKEGDFLTYLVDKTERKQKPVDSEVTLTFLAGNQLGLGADKKSFATLTADLAPVDGQPIEQDDLGMLYLPSASRRANTNTLGGIVQYEKKWERWSCWVVQTREGDLTGQRYYESRTGFLVGYELNMDNPDLNKGYFTKAVLKSTNIPGLQ